MSVSPQSACIVRPLISLGSSASVADLPLPPSPLLPTPATHAFPPPQAPCPPKQPLVEHALSMAQFTLAGGNIEDLLLQWSREVGPFYVFNIPGNPPVLVVSDPDAVKEVGHSNHPPTHTSSASCLGSYPCPQRHAAAVYHLLAGGPCLQYRQFACPAVVAGPNCPACRGLLSAPYT